MGSMIDSTPPQRSTTAPRPGGRSARVQAAVHQAVRELQQEESREGLTVPAIAARAGVTPSTIYRRWGDLSQLLANVAVEQLQPDSSPPETGSYRGDLEGWLEQYLDEMSSGPGRALLRDVLSADGAKACLCAGYNSQQIDVIVERARARGESFPSTADIIEKVVSPLLYRILFTETPPVVGDLHRWIDDVLASR